MCGIAGWIDWEQEVNGQRQILDRMVATLARRGPDACGTYFSQCAAIGHRRLSVVDPEGGKQPMIRWRGNHAYIITYNGELYNTSELRQELEAKGCRFTTTSDTEVLLQSYIEWGPDCVRRLNGIYALGIWDEKQETLFLARDRIGVKPLFYAQRGKALLFASELKALLAHPAVKPAIDREGLAEVLMLGPARTPGHGIFRDVYELKPGHSLVYNREGLFIEQYWKLVSQPHEDSFETTTAKIREILLDAVERQLVSDVPLCTLLSGGLDSSTITAIAALAYKREGRAPIHSFAVDYVDNDQYFLPDSFQPNADRPWARKVADYYQTDHTEIMIDTPELAEVLEDAAIARDLPGMADVDTSLYLFSREIKKHATVGLSGECADEVFGGYPWFRRQDMIQANTFPWATSPAIRRKWILPEVAKYIRAEEYVRDRYEQALGEVSRLEGEDPVAARMREIFYLSLTRFMPTLLDRKDRMSMAFGLELRVPFCDHRLVEYVWNVPWSMKNYQDREKGLLRHALTGLLPEDVLWRKKSPYPKTHNPLFLDIVKRRALAILSDPATPIRQVIHLDGVKEIAQSGLANSNIPWFGQLMSGPQLFAYIIQLDAWMKEYRVQLV
ncbi:asparagine synthase (glutamine-hydrolyzing) [Acetonema longum]|uniref:asparagine synthase (glutamine-hydrolyzing) n=1 Tax=Acetonema longum DSM 6540 TaxID=1009370 RepID=F7NGI3_9FIRM|nr:asparagine synthase (glutamine-hydrolyzing) [Acetonema longum]EGO64787.1 asparagine synthase (glutamine-hydrolyzing) [Acetonema longum DSM 6540]